jgi:hypothetical protein
MYQSLAADHECLRKYKKMEQEAWLFNLILFWVLKKISYSNIFEIAFNQPIFYFKMRKEKICQASGKYILRKLNNKVVKW